MRSGKRQITEGIEQLSKDRIRTLKEKETYKNLGILEVYTLKQTEMKEKNKKSISDERGNYSKPSDRNFIRRINTYCPRCKILWIFYHTLTFDSRFVWISLTGCAPMPSV